MLCQPRDRKWLLLHWPPVTLWHFCSSLPTGTEFVKPVVGYFCHLCQVIYADEGEAKGQHCSSPSHYRKYQVSEELITSCLISYSSKFGRSADLCRLAGEDRPRPLEMTSPPHSFLSDAKPVLPSIYLYTGSQEVAVFWKLYLNWNIYTKVAQPTHRCSLHASQG